MSGVRSSRLLARAGISFVKPHQKIFLKIENRDDMRQVDLIFRVRYRPFDFIVAKSGGEGCDIHPSGRFWPTSQCRGMGRPRVGAEDQSCASVAFI